MTPAISIIIPVFNEYENIAALKSQFKCQRSIELIFVDGNSSDGSLDALREWQQVQPNIVLASSSGRGRALQMNAGAELANANVLLFLHADTWLPKNFQMLVLNALEFNGRWGRFNVRLSSGAWWAKLISFFINHRSRLTGIATGDQALFFLREQFMSIGGFPEQQLMEDVEICKRLKKISDPVCLKEEVITSSRRWEKYGPLKTVFLMWQLRLEYFFGVPVGKLYEKYYGRK